MSRLRPRLRPHLAAPITLSALSVLACLCLLPTALVAARPVSARVQSGPSAWITVDASGGTTQGFQMNCHIPPDSPAPNYTHLRIESTHVHLTGNCWHGNSPSAVDVTTTEKAWGEDGQQGVPTDSALYATIHKPDGGSITGTISGVVTVSETFASGSKTYLYLQAAPQSWHCSAGQGAHAAPTVSWP